MEAFSSGVFFPVPCIPVMIGLLDVNVPKGLIRKHIREYSCIQGGFCVIPLAFFLGGPLNAAFPVAPVMWKKEASMRNIFIYLGAFSILKVPMVMFEMNFLGWRFTLIRSAAALQVFILIAGIMNRFTRLEKLPLSGIKSGKWRVERGKCYEE